MIFQETTSSQLTPRESAEMDYAERKFDKEAAYNLEVAHYNLEEAKVEARWSAITRIPITIIKLPVYILLGVGYIVLCATKQKAPDELWKLLK